MRSPWLEAVEVQPVLWLVDFAVGWRARPASASFILTGHQAVGLFRISATSPRLARRTAKPRSANRGSIPPHLPRIEEIIEPQTLIRGCGRGLHCIGEVASERLEAIPAQLRAIVSRRPTYACRSCGDAMAHAPRPGWSIDHKRSATRSHVAHELASNSHRHRSGSFNPGRGVGGPPSNLRPVYEAALADLKRSTKLFMDETALRRPIHGPEHLDRMAWPPVRDDRPGVHHSVSPLAIPLAELVFLPNKFCSALATSAGG